MRPQSKRRKCRCCNQLFTPDYRNTHRQQYCSGADCRKVAKAQSQRRWLRKSSNRDYFRGPEQVRRVQRWRKNHPGYWKKRTLASKPTQTAAQEEVNPEQRSCNVPGSPPRTLQDFCLAEDPAFVGLISMVTGSTLQEDIALTARQLLLRGQNILGLKIPGPLASTH